MAQIFGCFTCNSNDRTFGNNDPRVYLLCPLEYANQQQCWSQQNLVWKCKYIVKLLLLVNFAGKQPHLHITNSFAVV